MLKRSSSLDLLTRSDFIIIAHTTDRQNPQRHSMRRRSLSRIKPGARVINCARGGLVDEKALAAAIKDGAGSPAPPSTSYAVEPATDSPLFGLDNVICTPHLGAATDRKHRRTSPSRSPSRCPTICSTAP